MENQAAQHVIVAFDGDCLMCSRTIRWVADRDRADRIRFTRLQDPLGREMIEESKGAPLDSMLVRTEDGVVDRSAAVITVLEALGGIWRVLAILGSLIPRSWRDWLYEFIASHRYQWFGRGDACSMPSEALRRRLLP